MWNIRKIVKKGDYLYAVVPEHPYATPNHYVLLHRIVMENHLGRLLEKNEVVHHKDHNKLNNNIDNLELLDAHQHILLHLKDRKKIFVTLKCPWCNKIFTIPKNKSFLSKPKQKHRFNCCSRICKGKLFRFIQLHGISDELKERMNNNYISEEIRYLN